MLQTDGRTHAHTDARTDNVKTVYPPQTKFVGGLIKASIVSGVRSAMCAASQLPGKGPTDVDDAPAPAR